MLILIAESKTMAPCNIPVSQNEYILHTPGLESRAEGIMDSLRNASSEQLAEEVKLSLPMVRKLQQMIYEFPNKALGAKAIEAFTGVVFKAFDYQSLSAKDCTQANEKIRIISSLYGWLRPDDIVKPYRFDFTTPVAPGGKPLATYWRDAVTKCLSDELAKGKHHDILNLLPGDAARCVDWKLIGSNFKVWKADFKEILPGGITRTPNAGKLKTLRGRLLRQIITEDIDSPMELLNIEGDGYVGSDETDTSGNILFHTV